MNKMLRNTCRLGSGALSRIFTGQTAAGTKAGRRCLRTTASLQSLDDFQTRKILAEFNTLYDRNKDGFVDAKDIQEYDQVLHDYYSRTQGEYLRTTMSGYADYWTVFRELGDANHDGKLSKKEWLTMWERICEVTTDGKFKSLPQWVRLMPPVIFPIMDYKRDGVVDVEEYNSFWYEVGGVNADPTMVNKCMDAMTQNGELPLNLERFETLYADFYLSTSPDSAGQYMAGPVQYD